MRYKLFLLLFALVFIAGFESCKKSQELQPWLIGTWSRSGPSISSLSFCKKLSFNTATTGTIDFNNVNNELTYSYPTMTFAAIRDSIWQITKLSDQKISIRSGNGSPTTFVKQ